MLNTSNGSIPQSGRFNIMCKGKNQNVHIYITILSTNNEGKLASIVHRCNHYVVQN